MRKELSARARFALAHPYWMAAASLATLLVVSAGTAAGVVALTRVEFAELTAPWIAVQVVDRLAVVIAWTVGFVVARAVWVPAALEAHRGRS